MINICIFEDEAVIGLKPLTLMRPVYDLLVGASRIYDKVEHYFGHANITLYCRQELRSLVRKNFPGKIVNELNVGAACLLINGRVILTDELHELFVNNADHQYDTLFLHQGSIVGAYLKGDNLDYMKQALIKKESSLQIIKQLRTKCVAKELEDVYLIKNTWDLVRYNTEILKKDLLNHNENGLIKGKVGSYTVIDNESDVYVGNGAVIEDFVKIDATSGPVYIEEGALIKAHSLIEGPVYIGKGTQILRGNIKKSSIGEYCKIGGEVSSSVILGFTNKAHEGYLGGSYVAKWVNIGAGSSTSNLKNTYSNIKVDTGEGIKDTGMQFLGSIIGDQVRIGIGSLLNAGTMIGFGSSLYGGKCHPKFITPFTWGGEDEYKVHNLQKFFETADNMMARRKNSLDDTEKQIITLLHELTTAGM